MALYPSLEDMKVDKLIHDQEDAFMEKLSSGIPPSAIPAYTSNPYPLMAQMSTTSTSTYGGYPNIHSPESSHQVLNAPSQSDPNIYPDLHNFMGMELTKSVILANMPEYLKQRNQNQHETMNQNTTVSIRHSDSPAVPGMVAPLSGTSVGLQRAHVTRGIRELILCKGNDGRVGLRVQSIDKGIFVCLVLKSSPASLAGLRFGDQILQVNDTFVAGFTADDVHKLFKKCPVNNISVVVRDRPFESTITLHKDSNGSVGFYFKDGKITALINDSTAARNGVLIDHQLLEIDGQNVVGLKDKEINAVINSAPQIVTITVIPGFIYDHMMKKISTSWIRGVMDHSIPEF